MSGICGIVNLTGEPVSLPTLQTMCAALSHLGADANNVWASGGAGLGHLMMHTTPESEAEVLPLHLPGPNLCITTDARLDNREDLFQSLDITQPERHCAADSLLILKAYEKWGADCADHLLGDFAFAIWDEQNRRLFCCRDHMGLRPLVYYCDGRRFVFASEAKGILGLPEIAKELDKRRLAYLRLSGYFLVDNESTLYRNISILPGGTSLVLERDQLRKRRYWEPDLSARLPYKQDADILEAFRTLMFDAVRVRLRSATPVTAMLSGGLDSSAVVAVASQLLAQQGKRLTTLSAVVTDELRGKITDERQYIDEFRSWPSVDVNYVTDPERGPFDDVDELVAGYESPFVMSRHYLYTAIAAAARNIGARVILDGVLGELGPTFHGHGYYAELLIRLQWLTLIRELRSKRKVSGLSLKSDVLKDLLPPAIAGVLRRNPGASKWEEETPLRADFVNRELHDLLPQLLAAQRAVTRTWPNLQRNQYHRIFNVGRKTRSLDGFVGYQQVERRYPFLDKRVLEFCLAAPNNLKVRDGYKRYLIRAGLDGVLPPKIQWRTNKTAFSPDYQLRYNAQRKQVHSFLAEVRSSDPVRAVVDVDRIKTLAAADMTNPTANSFSDHAAMHIVPLAIYTIAFLRQFAEFGQ